MPRVRSSVVEHSAAVRMVPGSNPGVPCLKKRQSSPTRIRTAVAGFRVLSANHYTMGEMTAGGAAWPHDSMSSGRRHSSVG